jgi:hypothetical protein
MNINWTPLMPLIPSMVGGFIGGLTGGGFAVLAQFFATRWNYKNNARLAQNQSQKRINAILQAIKFEFEIACDIYYRKAGEHLEKLQDGQPYSIYFLVPEKWLIVFPNHTEVVGQIDDKELCKAIIDTYYQANYVIDGMKVNNWYLDKVTELRKVVARGGLGNAATESLLHYETQHREFASGLKEGSRKLKQWRDALGDSIEKYIAAHAVS